MKNINRLIFAGYCFALMIYGLLIIQIIEILVLGMGYVAIIPVLLFSYVTSQVIAEIAIH